MASAEYNSQYFQQNRPRLLESMRVWYRKNKESSARRTGAWYQANKERIRLQRLAALEQMREKERDSKRRQYASHPETFAVRAKLNRVKYHDRSLARQQRPENRLHSNVSRAIRSAIRLHKNGRKWEDLVGYTRRDLMAHLESLFKDGMTWDNYGEWEVDHIVPRARFSFMTPDDPEFRSCWALTNLQPLWMSDNRRKHVKDSF